MARLVIVESRKKFRNSGYINQPIRRKQVYF